MDTSFFFSKERYRYWVSFFFSKERYRCWVSWSFVLISIFLALVIVPFFYFDNLKAIIIGVEAFACWFFAFNMPKLFRKAKDEQHPEIRKSLNEFRELFRYVWFVWLIYFVYLFLKFEPHLIKEFKEICSNQATIDKIKYALGVIDVLLRNWLSMAIFLCYAKLDNTDADIDSDYRKPCQNFILLFSLLHIVGLLLLVYNFDNLSIDVSPNTIKQVALIQFCFNVLSSLIHSATFILLASRLSSKTIEIPNFYLGVLVVYAIIQPLGFLSSVNSISLGGNYSIESTALDKIVCFRYSILIAGKAFIFQILLWLFDKEMLVRYFEVIPKSEKATDEFKKQTEKERIEELVKEGKIIRAIEVLEVLFKDDKDMLKVFLLLEGQYNTSYNNYINGQADLKDFDIKKTQLSLAILEHIKHIVL